MEKPQYLYHGSQYYFDVVKPHLASGKSETESMYGIYASESFESVIPFALPIRWYPDAPDGKRVFSCEDGRTSLIYGALDPDGVGYIYKLKPDTFEQIDPWQWISHSEIVPEEIFEIKVRDYLSKIDYSREAIEICEKLYPERMEN